MAKRTFPCGHKGLGQYCHACAAADKVRAARRARHTTDDDMIDLSGLPLNVVAKAREVLHELFARRRHWGDLGGKQLVQHPSIVSVPVTRRYRLICRLRNGVLHPDRVMSHEEYNRLT